MVHLYQLCDRGMSGFVFPDGGAVLDQPIALTQAFAIISNGLVAARKANEK